jgi:ELWxxDGT repeat protein
MTAPLSPPKLLLPQSWLAGALGALGALAFAGASPSVALAADVPDSGENAVELSPFAGGVLYSGKEVSGPRAGKSAVMYSTPTATRVLMPVSYAAGGFGLHEGAAFFVAYLDPEDTTQGIGLYRTDGESVTRVKVLRSTPPELLGLGTPWVTSGGHLYFVAESDEGHRVWRTDGTEAGTVPATPPFTRSGPTGLTPVGCKLLFHAATSPTESGLWATDGTEEGTERLTDVYISSIYPPTSAGDRVFLFAGTQDEGLEPWVSDGTPSGTRLLRDIRPGSDSSLHLLQVNRPPFLTILDGKAYFAADDGERGFELWVSDGTPEGTRLAVELDPRVEGDAPLSGASPPLVTLGSHVYFVGSFPNLGSVGERRNAIVRSDGTPEGTELHSDGLEPVSAAEMSNPMTSVRFGVARNLLASHGRVYVAGYTPKYGSEVYELPAEPGFATLFHDAVSGGASSSPYQLAASGDHLFWLSNWGVNGPFRVYAKAFSEPCSCAPGETCATGVCTAQLGACAPDAPGGTGGTGSGASGSGAAASGDAGSSSAGAPGQDGSSSADGCGCRASPARPTLAAWLPLTLAVWFWRRRRAL